MKIPPIFPTRRIPHKVNEELPKVSLRELEREIFDIEKVRVIFRGEPRSKIYYSYLARFHLPLARTGEPTIRRLMKRIDQITDVVGVNSAEIIVPIYGMGKNTKRPKFVGIRLIEARLSKSTYWPFKGSDSVTRLQMQ